MNITEENNETVIRFGRILTKKEIVLLEICLAFFQSDPLTPNDLVEKDISAEGSASLNTDEQKEPS